MNNKLFYSLSIFILFFNLSFAQSVKYPITNYSKKDYGRDVEATNRTVVQDNRGFVYFGNANGILEFDGIRWNYIPVKRGIWITSLCVNEEGTVFVGSEAEFGFLAPDITGNLIYVSISDSLKEEERPFATVLKTFSTKYGTIFQTEYNLFVYKDSEVNIISTPTSFHLSFVVDDVFYVRMREVGLMKLVNGKLELVSDAQILKEYGIFGMIKFGDSETELLIITQELGLWKLDISKRSDNLIKLEISDEATLLNSGIYGGIGLSDGNYALNTLRRGVIIVDNKGEILSVIDKASGLRDNTALQLIQDKQNNLWVALNNGISRINYSSPLSYYSETSGILGIVHSINEYNNTLYIGTTQGLYKESDLWSNYSLVEFEQINFNNKALQIWNLTNLGNSLLVGTQEGLYQITDDQIKLVENINAYAVYHDMENKLVFVGGNRGLAVFKQNDSKLTLIKYFDKILSDIISITKNESRKDGKIELWLGTRIDGAIRLILDKDLNSQGNVNNYYTSLEGDYIYTYSFDNKVLFGTSDGFFEFVDEATERKELHDTLKNDPVFNKGYLQQTSIYNDTIIGAITAFTEFENTTWIAYDNTLGYYNKNNNTGFISQPFIILDKGKINKVFSDSGNISWIGADDGLISFRSDKPKDYDQEFKAYIRQVFIGTDSLIFNGTYYRLNNDESIALIDSLQPDYLKPIMKYKSNAITFNVTSNYYDKSKNILFSYKLIGSKDEWSQWTNDTKISFPYLREGDYQFLIRSKNIFGKVSKTDSFEFSILPPWYRTTYAYIGYLVLLIIVVYVIIRLSLMRLKQANERLERIVAERTEEIREERDKSDKLLLNTLPAKVVKDLKEKGKTEPESFEGVSVYFSDIVGFTNISSKLEPKALIMELNDMFTVFDDIMIRHHCERIKTIGDAYMAVCGMPERNKDHALNLMKAAIEIRDYLLERSKNSEIDWKIRIGINSGKAVGGIVGVRKYLYDIFGDTINTASRMESNSEPMRINVSQATYEILKDDYKFIPRLPIEVKGKGKMHMYFLEG